MDWLSYVSQDWPAVLGLDTAVAGGWLALVAGLVFRAGGHVIHNGFAGRPAVGARRP